MLPLGAIGPRLRSAPYVVVAHGAEITVPGAVPIVRRLGRRVLRGAAAVVAAGGYPARQATRVAGRDVPGVVVPPGVDSERFHPLAAGARRESRIAFGLDPDRPVVLGLSRLVPRKGFDVVIDAIAGMPDVQFLLAGAGRDLHRLQRRAIRSGADVTFLGRVPDDDLPRLYGGADVFAMSCRERWAGLEAEGFGIVFLEAAACAVPAVAGHSGGADEAVVDGETGYVVAPRDVTTVRSALDALCHDPARQAEMGQAARRGQWASTPTTAWWHDCSHSPAVISRPFRSFPADGNVPVDCSRDRGRHVALERRRVSSDAGTEGTAVIGKRIVVASWSTLGVFAVVAILDSVGLHTLNTPATILSVGLFLASLPLWIYAFGLVLVRSTRGDDIAVASWVFLTPSAPKEQRRHLLGATAACVAIGVATGWANPFGVLVPMLQLGFAALWGARHGVYPPRRPPARSGPGRVSPSAERTPTKSLKGARR